MRTRKRLTRQELKRDPFVDRVFDWALWSRENVRKVVLAVAALALLLSAILIYRTSRAGESRRVAMRYDEIWEAYSVGNYQLAANDFRQFLQQYPGSQYADDAAVYLGNSYLAGGDPAAAIKALQFFERDYANSPLQAAAVALLAAAYEASGDWVKAAEAYRKAREKARYEYERVEALLGEARAQAAAGRTAEAVAAYRKVLEDYAESPRVNEARVRLAELTAEPLVRAATAIGDTLASVARDSAGRAAAGT